MIGSCELGNKGK